MPSHSQFNYYYDDDEGITFGEPSPISKFHRKFTYYFDDDYGICFGPCGWTAPLPTFKYDLAIFYDGFNPHTDNFVEGRCSRWDYDDYSIIIETWLKKSDLDTLLDNIVPGATDVLYQIVGYAPNYYDSTWNSENSVLFYPTPSSSKMNGSNLYKMRSPKIGYVKHITTSPIEGPSDWMFVKIEANISGTNLY